MEFPAIVDLTFRSTEPEAPRNANAVERRDPVVEAVAGLFGQRSHPNTRHQMTGVVAEAHHRRGNTPKLRPSEIN